MEYLEATQVLEDRQTIGCKDDEQPKAIGILRVGSEEYRITEGLNRIGRSPVCPVVLEDPTVSKVHAEIHAGPDASFITDLRSVNGTTLKNLTLKPFFFYPINEGDVIAFGRVKAIYVTPKETLERVDVTPTTLVATTGSSRKASVSSTRHQDGFSFEDVNESIVPGSQRNDKKRRLFRRPELPHVEAPRNRGRISDIAGKSKNTDETRNDDDFASIYNAETQRTVDFQDSVLENTNGGRAKRPNESNESPKEAKITEDIHDMETQDILNGGSFVGRLTKRPRLEKSPTDVSIEDHADGDIFEAETQVSVPVREPSAKSPLPVAVDREDTIDEEAEKRRRRSRSEECRVIAETDDETNDASDGSVTDNENEFASLRSVAASKEPPEVIAAREARRLKVDSAFGLHDAETQRTEDYHREIAPRARSTARVINDDNDDGTDLELVPTQVLNAATSTPISRSIKSSAHFDFDESAPVMDCQDIHTALTQVVGEKNREVADASERPEESSAARGDAERNESPDTTINSIGDGLEKKLGNIFGNETTSDAEPTDEPTQLMTQNLVDILKMTQSCAREATASPTLPEKAPVAEASGAKIARKSPSPDGRSKIGTAEILGFVDGRAVGSQREFPRAPISRSLKDADDTARSANGPHPSRPLRSNDHDDHDDDILSGLPKFKIYGTLSNPGSPTSSENSSDDENLARSARGKAGSVEEPDAAAKRMTGKTESRSAERRENAGSYKSLVPDSPVVSKKSQPKRKYAARKRNTDDEGDSEDDLDYNDLKSIADKLLSASESAKDTTRQVCRAEAETRVPFNVAKASNVATKKMVDSRRPDSKLSEVPSSLIVADANYSDRIDDETETEKSVIAESSMVSRKRPRVAATMRNGRTAKRMGESLQVSSLKVDNAVPTLSVKCKAYAKVRLTRMNEIEVRMRKDKDVQYDVDGSKVTRTRRSTPKMTRETESSPKARATNRKTVGPIFSSPCTPNEQHRVLFTGVKDEEYENMVVKLGGVVVSDPSKASVLITDKVRRTFKFLCAVAQGMKIVDVNWLIESNETGHFLDCNSFTLRDPVAEDKFKFKLGKSLRVARTKKLLDGFTIIVTPKVNQPEIHELKGMAEACGGRVLVRAGRSWSEKTVIVSREDDLAAARAILSKAPKSLKISVQSTEFLLTGILRQEINLVDHKLL